MVDEINPIDQVFSGLWALVDESTPLKALVKPANMIRLDKDKDRDPFKTVVQVSDLPELTLLPDGITNANLIASTCESILTHNFTFAIATGDFRVVESLGKVQWALYSALIGWQGSLMQLEWKGVKFVKRANWVSTSHGFSDPTKNRGIKGWSALWSCAIDMRFPTISLKNFNQGL